MASVGAKTSKVLSCAGCRQRKVKCDKVQPICTVCSRLGVECVYPSRKPTRRAPRPRQNELLQRINRLETIISKAGPSQLTELDDPGAESGLGGDISTAAYPPPGLQPRGGRNPPQVQALHAQKPAPDPYADPKALSREATVHYLSSEFWGNLYDEVDGIRQALDQPSGDEADDADDQDDDTPETLGSGHGNANVISEPSGFILGNPKYSRREFPHHPPAQTIFRLWNVYTRNADPLIKILHRPTIEREIQAFTRSPPGYELPASKNALLMSIYFAAICTLSQEEAQVEFGEAQDVLADRFRLAIERALDHADYLNSCSLETLQAATVYVAALRSCSMSRACWVLTSMIIRIAQAMNLHRDGDGRRFSPFEAEMRRRLWHFIIALDIRASEDRGTEAVIMPSSYDTVRPTNIDDDSFGPDTKCPLIPKVGPADNVILMSLTRCCFLGYIYHPQTSNTAAGPATGKQPPHSQDEIVENVRAMEREFINPVDSTSPISARYAAGISRIVILKLWLMVQYPFSAEATVPPMRVSHEATLSTAVSIMEIFESLHQSPFDDRFAWWTRCYSQWHPLAVALAELCTQTEGELVTKAWKVVDDIYPRLKETVADSSSGPLWRPIRKLYKKAKEASAAAAVCRLSLSGTTNTGVPTTICPPAPTDYAAGQAVPPATMTVDMPAVDFAFDATYMDPSYLFQYPPELANMNFDPSSMEGSIPCDMAVWNEFVVDSHMDYEYSPEGSGGDGM